MSTMPRAMRVPTELWGRALARAQQDGTTVTAFVVQALTEWVDSPGRYCHRMGETCQGVCPDCGERKEHRRAAGLPAPDPNAALPFCAGCPDKGECMQGNCYLNGGTLRPTQGAA